LMWLVNWLYTVTATRAAMLSKVPPKMRQNSGMRSSALDGFSGASSTTALRRVSAMSRVGTAGFTARCSLRLSDKAYPPFDTGSASDSPGREDNHEGLPNARPIVTARRDAASALCREELSQI